MTHLDFRKKGGSLELHYNLLGFVWSMLNWRVFSSCRKDGVFSHTKKVFCWVFLTHFDPVTKRDYLLREFVVFVKPFMNYLYVVCFMNGNLHSISLIQWNLFSDIFWHMANWRVFFVCVSFFKRAELLPFIHDFVRCFAMFW